MALRDDVAAGNNLSTIDEAFTDTTLPAPRAPHHCGDLDPFRTIGQTSVDFLNHRVLIDSGKCTSMVHSPSTKKAWLETE